MTRIARLRGNDAPPTVPKIPRAVGLFLDNCVDKVANTGDLPRRYLYVVRIGHGFTLRLQAFSSGALAASVYRLAFQENVMSSR